MAQRVNTQSPNRPPLAVCVFPSRLHRAPHPHPPCTPLCTGTLTAAGFQRLAWAVCWRECVGGGVSAGSVLNPPHGVCLTFDIQDKFDPPHPPRHQSRPQNTVGECKWSWNRVSVRAACFSFLRHLQLEGSLCKVSGWGWGGELL